MRVELPPTAGLPLRWSDLLRTPRRPFAAGLAEWLHLPDPILTCSGTAALVVALKTLAEREPRRNRVVVPAYTCPLVPLAVRLAGLRAVTCDTTPGGFCFDPEKLDACCDASTLAVVPTHLGGRVADCEPVFAAARQCGAFVLEDGAQALGAFHRGVSVGLCGDAGFFSLAVGKGLTTYEGGVLFSRDSDLHAALRKTASRLLGAGVLWNLRRILELAGYGLAYRPSLLPLVYGDPLRRALGRGDEIEAVGDAFTLNDIPLHRPDRLRLRIAANALERLPDFLAQGRERALRRCAVLRRLGLELVEDGGESGVAAESGGVWPFLMLRLPTRTQRDRALDSLWRSGLGVSKLFIHALPEYGYLAGMLEGDDCPQARDLADRLLTITNSPWLDDAAFERIAEALRRCL